MWMSLVNVPYRIMEIAWNSIHTFFSDFGGPKTRWVGFMTSWNRISLHLGATCIHRIQGTNAVLAEFVSISVIPNHYFCCCLATSIDLRMLKNEKTLATSCVDPSLHTNFGPSFLSFTPFQWHPSSSHLSWSWDRRNGPSADWSCDTSGGDNTHDVPSHSWLRYAVLHLSGSLICVGVLSKWAASREGWLPKGSHQRQYSYYLLLTSTEWNSIGYIGSQGFFHLFSSPGSQWECTPGRVPPWSPWIQKDATTKRAASRTEGRISIQYQVVFWTIYYTILYMRQLR